MGEEHYKNDYTSAFDSRLPALAMFQSFSAVLFLPISLPLAVSSLCILAYVAAACKHSVSLMHLFMSCSWSQRRAQAGRQSGRPDALGTEQPAELGSDILPPAGAGKWRRLDVAHHNAESV